MKITVDVREVVLMGVPSWVLRVREGRGEPMVRAPEGVGLGFFSVAAAEAGLSLEVDLRLVAAGAGLGAWAAGAGFPAFRALRLGAASVILVIRLIVVLMVMLVVAVKEVFGSKRMAGESGSTLTSFGECTSQTKNKRC